MSTETQADAQQPLAGLAALIAQSQDAQRLQATTALSDRFQDTMDAILSAYARARIQRMEILNHNGAMLGYVSKAAVARAMGLDEKQRLGVTPFPAPISITMADPSAAERERALQQQVDALRQSQQGLAAQPLTAPRPTTTAQSTDQPSEPQQAADVTPAAASPGTSDQQPKSLWSKVWPLLLTAALGAGGTAATMYATRTSPTTGSVDLEIEGWQQTQPTPETG